MVFGLNNIKAGANMSTDDLWIYSTVQKFKANKIIFSKIFYLAIMRQIKSDS